MATALRACCCCSLLALAAAAPRLTLTNFHTLPPFLQLDAGLYDKKSYWEHLANVYGYRSGFQRTPDGLCPVAHDGAPLALPSCLLASGVRYAVFIGDSLTHEMAWSFARLAAAKADEPCQHTGGEHERWAETKHDPSFTCRVQPAADGPAICSAEAQLQAPAAKTGYERGANGVVADCCQEGRFSLYFHDYDFDEVDVHDTLQRYKSNCNCPSLVYLSLGGMHRLLGAAAFAAPEVQPSPWSYPFGRMEGVHQLVANATAGVTDAAALRRIVLASTPKPNHGVMMAFPAKFDWKSFADMAALKLWVEQDRRTAKAFNITYAHYYEASKEFSGLQARAAAALGCLCARAADTHCVRERLTRTLRARCCIQCDGIHFGNSWETVAGCSGFTAVSDLITHQYLGAICEGAADVAIQAAPRKPPAK
jgi:hypothetical protein